MFYCKDLIEENVIRNSRRKISASETYLIRLGLQDIIEKYCSILASFNSWNHFSIYSIRDMNRWFLIDDC